jgi:hypothetical protein
MLPVAALLLDPEQALVQSTARIVPAVTSPETEKDEKVDVWLTFHTPAADWGLALGPTYVRSEKGPRIGI